jgi:hypothetical protein
LRVQQAKKKISSWIWQSEVLNNWSKAGGIDWCKFEFLIFPLTVVFSVGSSKLMLFLFSNSSFGFYYNFFFFIRSGGISFDFFRLWQKVKHWMVQGLSLMCLLSISDFCTILVLFQAICAFYVNVLCYWTSLTIWTRRLQPASSMLKKFTGPDMDTDLPKVLSLSFLRCSSFSPS